MNFIILFFKGIIIGIANAIPGVSGGTLALMLGIYEDLINGIKSIDLPFLKLILKGKIREALSSVPLSLFACVGSGALFSIIVLSKIFSWLLTHKPVLINAFFFGLILATIPIIAHFIKKWTPPKLAIALATAIGTYHLVNVVPLQTPNSPWFVFLCGVIAISSMILPGLSGSFMLIILGKYHFILDAINNKDLFVLGVFSLGLAVGIISFVRILSWLFNKFHDLTIAILTGLVVGSLDKIWPWKETISTILKKGELLPFQQKNILPGNFDSEVIFAIALIIAGMWTAFLLNTSTNKTITISQ